MDNRKSVQNLCLTICLSLRATNLPQFSLTKLILSRDLPCSVVTSQIAFDQQDLLSSLKFEVVMDCHCLVQVSNLETLDSINFTYLSC